MPISTDTDRVRLEIGDTDTSDPLLSDEEIAYFISQRQVVVSGGTVTNIPAAAADSAGAIAAKYARQFDFSEDGQSFSRAQRVGQYQALEQTLRARSGVTSVRTTLAGTETIS